MVMFLVIVFSFLTKHRYITYAPYPAHIQITTQITNYHIVMVTVRNITK